MQTDKKWGYETLIASNEKANYTGKILTLLPNGMASSIHFHEKKVETFYCTRGWVYLETYDEPEAPINYTQPLKLTGLRRNYLSPGSSITIECRIPHRFWTESGIAEFIETSTFDTPDDTIRIIDSGPIPQGLV